MSSYFYRNKYIYDVVGTKINKYVFYYFLHLIPIGIPIPIIVILVHNKVS